MPAVTKPTYPTTTIIPGAGDDSGGGEGGGPVSHGATTGRNSPNQHQMSAITGLTTALSDLDTEIEAAAAAAADAAAVAASAVRWAGSYDSDHNEGAGYQANDLVVFNDTLYRCTVDGTTGNPDDFPLRWAAWPGGASTGIMSPLWRPTTIVADGATVTTFSYDGDGAVEHNFLIVPFSNYPDRAVINLGRPEDTPEGTEVIIVGRNDDSTLSVSYGPSCFYPRDLPGILAFGDGITPPPSGDFTGANAQTVEWNVSGTSGTSVLDADYGSDFQALATAVFGPMIGAGLLAPVFDTTYVPQEGKSYQFLFTTTIDGPDANITFTDPGTGDLATFIESLIVHSGVTWNFGPSASASGAGEFWGPADEPIGGRTHLWTDDGFAQVFHVARLVRIGPDWLYVHRAARSGELPYTVLNPDDWVNRPYHVAEALNMLAAGSPRRTLVADVRFLGVTQTEAEMTDPSNMFAGFLPVDSTVLMDVDGAPEIWKRVEQDNPSTDPGFVPVHRDILSGPERANDNIRVAVAIDPGTGSATPALVYAVAFDPMVSGAMMLVERGEAITEAAIEAATEAAADAVSSAVEAILSSADLGNPGIWKSGASVIDCMGTDPVLDGTSRRIGPNASSGDIAEGPVLLHNTADPADSGWWIFTPPSGPEGEEVYTPLVRATGATVIAEAPDGGLTIAQAVEHCGRYQSITLYSSDVIGIPSLHALRYLGEGEDLVAEWAAAALVKSNGQLRLEGTAVIPTWATSVQCQGDGTVTLADSNAYVVIRNDSGSDLNVQNNDEDVLATIPSLSTYAFLNSNGFSGYHAIQLDGPSTFKVAPLVVASNSADIDLDPDFDVFPIEMAFTETDAVLDVNAAWLADIPGRQIKVFITDRQDASTTCVVHAAGQDATVEPGQAVTITALDASVGIVEFSATP